MYVLEAVAAWPLRHSPRRYPGFNRLVGFVVVVAVGTATAAVASLEGIYDSEVYLLAATTLLAIGLYASASGISVEGAREHLRLVLAAVTVGVLIKATLIAVVMYLAFGRRAEYLILGVAVAQIDPLSVAAMRRRSAMSRRASTILSAWASFDDPMTALLTVYAAGWLMTTQGMAGGAGAWAAGSVLTQILLNGLLALGAFLVWRLTTRTGEPGAGAAGAVRGTPAGTVGRIIQLAALLAVLVLGVWRFLMLGVALCGLFLRPWIDQLVERVTGVAFWLAAFALGLILVEGVRPLHGVVLGLAAFGSQIVVGWLLSRRLPADDRTSLMLGHQNGITAIILALLLEPRFPGTVSVVAPAIITVNLLYTASNAARRANRRPLASDQTEEEPAPVARS